MKVYTDLNLVGPGYPVGYNILALSKTIISYVNFMKLKFSHLKEGNNRIVFWCRGSSGAILAGLVAHHLNLDGFDIARIHHIKKEGEESHINAHHPFSKNDFNIVIDDFIASGETIYSILNVALNHLDNESPIIYKEEMDLLLITDDVRINQGYCKAFKNIYCKETRNDYTDQENLEIERL